MAGFVRNRKREVMTFQVINFNLQNLKAKTLLVDLKKLFVFSSKAKHDFFIFLSGLLKRQKIQISSKKTKEWRDSIKWALPNNGDEDYTSHFWWQFYQSNTFIKDFIKKMPRGLKISLTFMNLWMSLKAGLSSILGVGRIPLFRPSKSIKLPRIPKISYLPSNL